MTLAQFVQTTLILTALALIGPNAALAKPNSYPGENSKFKQNDPAALAKWEAERAKRIELRKQRREERRRKRLNQKSNRQSE